MLPPGATAPTRIGSMSTASPNESRSIPYVPAVDGLRALAIAAVLVYHARPATLPGGFTGVDVFFVLSGFLITSILLRDLAAGRASLREFYLRRIQRLLPNIVATVLVVLALWHARMLPSASRQAGAHGLWSLVNLSNFYVWGFLGGYWDDAAEAAPFTHLWSLGVEEQFYLLYPAALALLVRSQRSRVFAWLALAALASFVASWIVTSSSPSSAFYLLPTRLWELLLGALVALHRARTPRPPGVVAREWLGWLGLVCVFAGYAAIGERTPFPGTAALAPTLGTVLLLLAVLDSETRIARALSHRALVATGLVSYSLYLWHWPLILFGRAQAELRDWPSEWGAWMGAAASIAVAIAVYFAVERPLRRRGPGRRRRLQVIAAGFGVAVAASAWLASRPISIDPHDRFATPSFSGQLYDTGRSANDDPSSSIRYADVDFERAPAREPDLWRTGGIVHRHGGGDPQVVVLGSSQALMYGRMIDDVCRELGLSVAFLTADEGAPALFRTSTSGNFPTRELAREFDDTRRHWLRTWRPEAIVLADLWDFRMRAPRRFDARLRAFLTEVSPLVERVLFVAQVPVIANAEHLNLRELVLWRMGEGGALPRLAQDEFAVARRRSLAIAESAGESFPKLRILRADLPFVREDGSVRYADGREFYYADDDHLAQAGAERVRDLFAEALREAHRAAAAR